MVRAAATVSDSKSSPARPPVDLARVLNLPGRALLDEHEAAAALHLSVRLLREWRRRRIGPKYLKINSRALRYRLSDLELARRLLKLLTAGRTHINIEGSEFPYSAVPVCR